MASRRGASGGVDWLPVESRGTAIANLAANGQATVIDQSLKNPNGDTPYGSGALVGLRGWLSVVQDGGSVLGPLVWIAMILPVGMTVPNVNTQPLLKAAERYVWFMTKALPKAVNGTAAACVHEAEVQIGSSRRFDQNDRLVVVAINRTGGALNAGAIDHTMIDVYVRED